MAKARKTFRVYFTDGNQRLYEAENLYSLVAYIYFELNYSEGDVYKVEEVQ